MKFSNEIMTSFFFRSTVATCYLLVVNSQPLSSIDIFFCICLIAVSKSGYSVGTSIEQTYI